MARYTYTGHGKRVLPTLGIIVKPNEEFDAPEGFKAPNVKTISTGKTKTTIEQSEKSDETVGE